ncbi:carboxypeptidase-like regulatory domain-containing protein [Methanocella sp. MCL-LM]|uniref:carboxypeptidase-like regulatory domain-containing protein n=1 Tax=Methanocella sp. MCL-LM TaxID=3412035 RepID=UPI003C7118CE
MVRGCQYQIVILSFLLLGIATLPYSAVAINNTFSIYGTVTEQNGTPIPGTSIRLIESSGGPISFDGPGFQSTVTDDQGRFTFVNVTIEADRCWITIHYPDHKQYFPPGNSMTSVPASGVQYVNVTRIPIESDAPPGYDTAHGFEAILAMICIILICIVRNKK